MVLITWLISMVIAIVFGLFAAATASIVIIYRAIFDGGVKWSPENLYGIASLTQFKEFFTGGSEQGKTLS